MIGPGSDKNQSWRKSIDLKGVKALHISKLDFTSASTTTSGSAWCWDCVKLLKTSPRKSQKEMLSPATVYNQKQLAKLIWICLPNLGNLLYGKIKLHCFHFVEKNCFCILCPIPFSFPLSRSTASNGSRKMSRAPSELSIRSPGEKGPYNF